MKLSEYRSEIEGIESGHVAGIPQALVVMAMGLSRELRTACWATGCRTEAAELAERAEEIVRRFDASGIDVNYSRVVGTLAEHCPQS